MSGNRRDTELVVWNLRTGSELIAREGLCLRVMRGEMMEVLGIDGSGKSVLGRLLAGREAIRGGFVEVAGVRYRSGRTLDGCDELMYIGRDPCVAPELTVAENICLLSKRRKVKHFVHRKNMEQRVSFLLSEYGPGIRADQKMRTLSEGEVRVTELLRAVENEVPLICIDGAFDGIGQSDMRLIETCLLRMKRMGFTILCIGGGFPRFLYLDDRVTVFRGGRNVRTFYPENYDRSEFVKWMTGTESGQRIPREGAASEEREDAAGEREELLLMRGISGECLDRFSCRIMSGEIVGLYDMDNRANRELAEFLTGRRKLEHGAMVLGGREYAPLSPEDAVRKGTCFIPSDIESRAVVGKTGIGENLLLPVMRENSAGGFLVNRRVIRYLERRFLSSIGAEDAEGRAAGELDVYQRMALALERCLLMKPRLLVGEDILNDLDLRMIRTEREYFKKLAEGGAAVILSSPNLSALRQLCGRILVLSSPPDEQDRKKVHLFEMQSD